MKNNNLIKIVSVILFVIAIFINPYFIVNLITETGKDPYLSVYQIIFLELALIFVSIDLYFNLKMFKGDIPSVIAFLISFIFIFMTLEDKIRSVVTFSFLFLIFAFYLTKRKLFVKNRKEIKLLWFTLLFILVFIEIFSRIYLVGPLTLIPAYGSSIVEFSRAGLIQKSIYNDISYELIPNIDKKFLLVDVKTNSMGLRDKEYSLNKPSNTYRIAVLGDSSTFPFGVQIEDAYHSLAEQILNTESNKSYEFINFGLGGYSLSNYLSVIENKVLNYSPDHIIIGFLHTNDFNVDEHLNFSVKKERTNGYIRLYTQRLFGFFIDNIKKNSASVKKEGYNLQRINELFSELNKTRFDNSINITFLLLARPEEVNQYNEEYNLVKNLTFEYRFPIIEVYDKFESIPFLKTQIFRVDPHGNELYNSIVADALEKYFIDMP